MVERSGVYVYAHDDVDITTTGLVGDLLPIKCTFTEEKNGKSLIEMQLHYDQWGKWRAVKPGNYIKALVPVRVPPKIVNNLFAESVTTYRLKKSITKEVTVYVSNGTKSPSPTNPENFRLHYVVDTGGAQVPVKKKSTLTTDMDVQILEEKDDGRCKVYHPSFGSGWTFKDNLEQVKTDAIRQTIDGVEGVAEAVKLQYQLFQIDQVEQTLRHINVTANHVFYELSRNYTTYKNEADMEAFVTINGVMDNLVAPDARFTVLTDCSDSGGAVDYDQQNVVQAFLDPENGICARYGLSLLRDNYDIYALKEVGSDRGFVVEYAKNMLGVNRTEDITDTFTRLIPWGKDKNGNPVYLDEKHIDSPHLSDYAFPRIAYLTIAEEVVAPMLGQWWDAIMGKINEIIDWILSPELPDAEEVIKAIQSWWKGITDTIGGLILTIYPEINIVGNHQAAAEEQIGQEVAEATGSSTLGALAQQNAHNFTQNSDLFFDPMAIINAFTSNQHETGLLNVPHDDYLARLHRGEMVLTRNEAEAYRRGGSYADVIASIHDLGNAMREYALTPVPIVIDGDVIGSVMYERMNRRIENGNLQQIFGMGG